MRNIGNTWPDSELAATTIRPESASFISEQRRAAAESRRLRTLLPSEGETNLFVGFCLTSTMVKKQIGVMADSLITDPRRSLPDRGVASMCRT